MIRLSSVSSASHTQSACSSSSMRALRFEHAARAHLPGPFLVYSCSCMSRDRAVPAHLSCSSAFRCTRCARPPHRSHSRRLVASSSRVTVPSLESRCLQSRFACARACARRHLCRDAASSRTRPLGVPVVSAHKERRELKWRLLRLFQE